MLVTQVRIVSRTGRGRADARHKTALRMDDAGLVDAFERCDTILREVAKAKGAVFVDAASALSGKPEWFLDLIHLRPEAAERLAEIVARELDSRLQRPANTDKGGTQTSSEKCCAPQAHRHKAGAGGQP